MRPAARRIAALCAAFALALAPGAWAAPKPRTSLTAVEPDVICTVCHEPLAEAQSPEADQERTYIRSLIAQGLTKAQIEKDMVAQYGPGVLGRPPAHGLNLTVYILPPALVLAGLLILATTLPRWRRRTRAAAQQARHGTPPPALEPAEAQRLDRELSQFPG